MCWRAPGEGRFLQSRAPSVPGGRWAVVPACSFVSDSLQPLGSSVHGILQERILEWVAIFSSGDHPDPGIKAVSLALTGGFFTS